MKIPPFRLEEFWKLYEFTAPYLFCPSDMEPWRMQEILAYADAETKPLWETLSLGYTESPGLPLLREEIASLYSLDKEAVLTLAGAEEGIYCTLQALLSPGDHVITFSPSYQSLETLPQACGAAVTVIPLRADENWQVTQEMIEKAFRPKTKMVILNCPHNPTGMLLKRNVFDFIIALARKQGTYIFCDEVYRYLELDPSQRLPAIAEVYEKGISLNVMTKAFGLAGLRIGWIASQDANVIEKVGAYKLYTSICNSAPSEVLALIALRAKQQILERNRSLLLHNMALLDAFFERQKERIRWVRPQGGTMGFPELLLPLSIERFMEELVKKAGVLVIPGSVFALPGNFFRIGFGRKNMPEVLARFESFLKTYPL